MTQPDKLSGRIKAMTSNADYINGLFDSLKNSTPDIIHIRGDELNKLLECNKYDIHKWYQMTEKDITELDI